MEQELNPLSAPPESKVSKASVLRYVEEVFACADQDQDGALTLGELENFLDALVHPYRNLVPHPVGSGRQAPPSEA